MVSDYLCGIKPETIHTKIGYLQFGVTGFMYTCTHVKDWVTKGWIGII